MTKKPKVPTSGSGEPIHRPFAGLAALRDQLAGRSKVEVEVEEASPPPPPGLAGKIVVHREKKGHGGKTMTRISGVELPPAKLDELMVEMKRALGCGAIVEDGDVLLQGAQTERAKAFLEKRGARNVVVGN
jgi:translation initiation factor 1